MGHLKDSHLPTVRECYEDTTLRAERETLSYISTICWRRSPGNASSGPQEGERRDSELDRRRLSTKLRQHPYHCAATRSQRDEGHLPQVNHLADCGIALQPALVTLRRLYIAVGQV